MIACNGIGLSCQPGCISVNVHGLGYITLWIAYGIKGVPVDMLQGGVRLFFFCITVEFNISSVCTFKKPGTKEETNRALSSFRQERQSRL